MVIISLSFFIGLKIENGGWLVHIDPYKKASGAGDEIRTHDIYLGNAKKH
tara:strand:- start:2022 stop:2171 length:150 start_codon:yes stop_codon:yes gene_type:complete